MGDQRAVTGGFPPDQLDGAVDGRLLEVGQVHGDLGLPLHQHAHRLDEVQAAAGMADGAGDPVGDPDVGRVQVDVEGDQEGARADDGRPRRAEGRRAEVRGAVGIGGDALLQPFIFARADGRQVLALRTGRCRFVEVNRDAQFAAHPLPQAAGDGYAVGHGRPAQGHEGHDIRRADAGMLPAMLVQVDQPGGGRDGGVSGLLHRLRRADEGHHGAVVVGVAAGVQDGHAGHGADGGHDLGDDLRAAAFAEVGDTFNERVGHFTPLCVRVCGWRRQSRAGLYQRPGAAATLDSGEGRAAGGKKGQVARGPEARNRWGRNMPRPGRVGGHQQNRQRLG